MLKVISKTPVIPQSLIVSGVKIPIERDYIGSGFFGSVFKGKLDGTVVALKVLSDCDDQAVRLFTLSSWHDYRFRVHRTSAKKH